jgi:hypothetical protein
MRQLHIALVSLGLVLASCGHRANSNADGDANISGDGSPNSDASVDALTPPNCVPGATQCTDCKDNDRDGRADGYDPECTGALDNDEGSFATGIPGDNKDAVKQDCFFDGNSGGGQDCSIHVCCLLGAATVDDCPIGKQSYDPSKCSSTQTCRDKCLPLVPAGCDCYGCCTVCDPSTNECRDVITNPVTSPNCNDTNITDPAACLSCVKAADCSNPCGSANCILCPGQDISDLPATCGGTNACANGQESCVNEVCPAGKYCASGCCILEGVLL